MEESVWLKDQIGCGYENLVASIVDGLEMNLTKASRMVKSCLEGQSYTARTIDEDLQIQDMNVWSYVFICLDFASTDRIS